VAAGAAVAITGAGRRGRFAASITERSTAGGQLSAT